MKLQYCVNRTGAVPPEKLALTGLEVLAAGHHGSRYSTSQALLDQTRPECALISVGADNSYGHPAQETVERIAAAGAEIYRTDVSGTITVQINET